MLKRILRSLASWMCVSLVLAFAGNLASAETTVPVDYGTIEAIEIFRSVRQPTRQRRDRAGRLAGGVIGHQIGSGRGNTAATIAGAIGGAVVGNEIEKKQVQGSRYRITVRLDSGSTLIVEDTRDVNLRVGDRVRVENNRIHRV